MAIMKIVIDGIITDYNQIGTGDKNLLILHGWGRSYKEWIQIANSIKGYRVTLVDLPGFGDSEEPYKVFGVFDYSKFVADFLKKIDIKSCTILGHSFGGRLGTILAVKEPELVEKLILVDSGGIEIRSLKTKIKILLFKLLKPFKIFIPKKILKKFGSSDYKETSGVMRKSFVKIINHDLRYLFPKVKQPVSVIWGSDDRVLPAWYVKIYKSYIPQSTIRIVWEADHSPYLSKPKDFIEILKEELL